MSDQEPVPFLEAKLVIHEKQFQDILFAATLSGIVAGELMNREVVQRFVDTAIRMCPAAGSVRADYVLELLKGIKDMQTDKDIPDLIESFRSRQGENPVFSPEYRAMSKEIVPGFFELDSRIDFMEVWTKAMLTQFKPGGTVG
jgi:hypothetical protein